VRSSSVARVEQSPRLNADPEYTVISQSFSEMNRKDAQASGMAA
jgi:hypothetical protein